MSLYFILLTATGIFPIALSFDKRLQFYKRWNKVLPAILLVAGLYIAFDIRFTKQQVWGFNPRYLSGSNLFSLPLEEILFFIVVPYASLFLHESILEYFPKLRLNSYLTKTLMVAFLLFCLAIAIINTDKTYTFYIALKLAVVLILALISKSEIPRSFFITFLVILVPFLLVNGILTGSFIAEEVVWYNDNENMGWRFFTIPIEDFAYAFSMILCNLLLIEQFSKIEKRND
ncbi:lycopene cyclase domain-containing protein [uncultured Draconibacterium sp.]|uniref:lycopene cyclase domain-containing protein n=1 Tax=uncultured Draconibacterium sp. TaxID=1573823 RepID=UPI0025E82FC1|nr:lycopene cyclase domain-containing protein [uncultured Draconibacterium sp.]